VTGRLIALNGASADAGVRFGGEPVSIGSGPEAAVRIEAGADVAPVHALVWIKDGKIMLRHVAGHSRRTLVDGRPVEWVILEDGDVFSVGSHRWRVARE
jgi:hypothetical protein